MLEILDSVAEAGNTPHLSHSTNAQRFPDTFAALRAFRRSDLLLDSLAPERVNFRTQVSTAPAPLPLIADSHGQAWLTRSSIRQTKIPCVHAGGVRSQDAFSPSLNHRSPLSLSKGRNFQVPPRGFGADVQRWEDRSIPPISPSFHQHHHAADASVKGLMDAIPWVIQHGSNAVALFVHSETRGARKSLRCMAGPKPI